MAKKGFLTRLAAGDILVSDGATGTNLQRMGLPVGAPAEIWVLENPDGIQALNKAFINAGSDIILTCTFGATQHRLTAASLGESFTEINRKAIEITQRAAEGNDVLVAGSIGPIGEMLAPLGTISIEDAEADFRDQARLLCEGGVDLIVVETQFDINEAGAAVRGVRAVDPEIPLVCSFSYDRGVRTMMGTKPEDVAEIIGAMDVDVLGINCGRSLNDNQDALTQLQDITEKPIWFKPNAGMPETDAEGLPTYSVTPGEMGALVPVWLQAGAQIVGGCCGTSPEHLAEIVKWANA